MIATACRQSLTRRCSHSSLFYTSSRIDKGHFLFYISFLHAENPFSDFFTHPSAQTPLKNTAINNFMSNRRINYKQ